MTSSTTVRAPLSLEQEIELFAERKKQYILSHSDVNEEAWREEIRRQLEAELSNRVTEALATPTNNWRRTCPRRDNHVNKEQQADDGDTGQCHQRDYNDSQQWKSAAEHHIRQILCESSVELSKQCYTRQHSQMLLQSLRQLNYHRLQQFLLHKPHLTFQDCSTASAHKRTRAVNSDQLSQKVASLNDLNELTSSERHSFNYSFTRQGFTDVLRSQNTQRQQTRRDEILYRTQTQHDIDTTTRVPAAAATDADEVSCYQPPCLATVPEAVCRPSMKWYKELHTGLLRTVDGPFWPIDYAPLYPTPIHLTATAQQPATEPLLTTDRSPNSKNELMNSSTTTTTRCKPWRGMVIVYDSERTPRDLQATPPGTDGRVASLLFESRFESGNLRQARRVGDCEYELVLRADLYTTRHTQWFYFRVHNATPRVTYTFKIINLLKNDSLYNHEGMQPLVYSSYAASVDNVGWCRCGHNISYTRNVNNLQCPLLSRDKTYYILQWQMEFTDTDIGDNVYYLAHCYPYTYTDLCVDLDELAADSERSKVMKREMLCQTRAGNSCFLLTITDFDIGASSKQGIIITARVHPGETNSSWVMKGLLQYLTGDSDSAQALRRLYIFKVVPMLNPDGVIVGNYRCSLSGRDMNRNYRHPRRETFPTVYHLKLMVYELSRRVRVALYCDLHGHSRRQNLFMYGCSPTEQQFTVQQFLAPRIFPWLLALKAPDKFSFDCCKFNIRRNKESTGRVVMFRQFNILNSFTLETTLCGTTLQPSTSGRHLNIPDLLAIGRIVCQAFVDFNRTQCDALFASEILLNLSQHLTTQITSADDVTVPSGDSVDDCLELLEHCKNQLVESDSSSSDTDSEPEFISQTKQRRHRRKKKSKNSQPEVRNSLPAINAVETDENKNQQQQDPTIADVNRRKQTASFPVFVNKYEGRSNRGIPCFSEERLRQRASRRLDKLQQHYQQQQQQQQHDFELQHFVCVSDEQSSGTETAAAAAAAAAAATTTTLAVNAETIPAILAPTAMLCPNTMSVNTTSAAAMLSPVTRFMLPVAQFGLRTSSVFSRPRPITSQASDQENVLASRDHVTSNTYRSRHGNRHHHELF